MVPGWSHRVVGCRCVQLCGEIVFQTINLNIAKGGGAEVAVTCDNTRDHGNTGNTVPAGNTLSLMSALYLWATLGCGVFGCHGNLV